MDFRIISGSVYMFITSMAQYEAVLAALDNKLCRKIIKALMEEPKSFEQLAHELMLRSPEEHWDLKLALKRLKELKIVGCNPDGIYFLAVDNIVIDLWEVAKQW